MKFDGDKFAKRIEKELTERVRVLGRKPVLVILWVGESTASNRYVEKKKAAGERIGVEVKVERVSASELEEGVKRAIKDTDGVMVQLPVPGMEKGKVQKIIDLIPASKDVDGLTSENLKLIATGEQEYLPATVKGIGRIMDEAIRETGLDIEKMKVAVVGSRGMVGAPLVSQLKRFGFSPIEFEVGDEIEVGESDVVISATGKKGLIKSEMVKDGVVAIDVGYPGGDFDVGVEKKAGFYTPVPGGVGPMTVISLMENVISTRER